MPSKSKKAGGLMAPIRRLYDWTLSWADHPAGSWALFVLGGLEVIFFPIPTDTLGIALSAGKPKKSFWFVGVATAGTLVGAALGYLIGWGLWSLCGEFIQAHLVSPEQIEWVRTKTAENVFIFVLAAAFTPLPDKVVTLAGGFLHIAFLPFLLAMGLGKGLRFLCWGIPIYILGSKVKAWIDKYFDLAVTLGFVLLIGGFFALKFLHHG